MKKNLFKKAVALASAALMTLSLAGCGQSASSNDEIKVAVIKQLDHAPLDEIANAITAELDVLAETNGVKISYTVYSGQNDQSTLKQISDQAVAEGCSVIIPIATMAAQVAATSTTSSKTPVVYAAISDPEGAGLTEIDNVTGTSDMLDTATIIDMIFTADPDATKIGLLYSLSETNSTLPIAQAKELIEAKGASYIEYTASANDEVIAAVSSLIAEGVDAVFTPTDNVIMAAELAIYDDLAAAGIPHYTGADSFVRNGGFTTCGVNYTALGTKTADLAYQAVTQGMADMDDYYTMEGGIVTVNTETAQTIGIDYSGFSAFGEIVEVTTTED